MKPAHKEPTYILRAVELILYSKHFTFCTLEDKLGKQAGTTVEETAFNHGIHMFIGIDTANYYNELLLEKDDLLSTAAKIDLNKVGLTNHTWLSTINSIKLGQESRDNQVSNIHE